MVKHFEAAKEKVDFTPSLVIDLPTVERNIARLHDYAATHQLAIRPHTKTHKSRRFAKLQLEAGAQGLTVAKVGEAEVMALESNDILIAYPAIDLHRRERIAKLAQGNFVRVAVDSVEHISLLAESARKAGSTVGILVDVNVGSDRTGVANPEESLELAQQVAQHEGALRLDGIFFYPGQIWNRPEEQIPRLKQVDALLAEVIELWKTSGLAAPIVSGGSTPTAFQSHWIGQQTEIRPGTYLFNDMNTARAGFCELEDCAAAIVATVVSRAVAGKAVIDAGSKTLTSDRNVTQPDSGHGYVVEYPAATVVRLSEEHGELDLSRCETQPKLGERLTIIPNHICPCVNLQDKVVLFDNDHKPTPTSIDTRGMLS
ncbi:MAG: alanine racemase [Pirellulaceae bacterium]